MWTRLTTRVSTTCWFRQPVTTVTADFSISGNTWTYTLNNSSPVIQALGAGQTLTDTYTFLASDGSSQEVTITIDGTDDPSVIGGVSTGTVSEDTTLTTSNTLTITDVDTPDTPSFKDAGSGRR